MKLVGLSVLLTLCANAQMISDFSSVNPLHITPTSFNGDIYTSPRGWQEIGGLGQATQASVAYSDTFAQPMSLPGIFPVDTRTWTTVYDTVPNPNYDPGRPIGLFNPGPPTIQQTRLVQTGGTLSYTPAFYLYWAQGQNTLAQWRLTFYDTSGGSAYYNFTSAVAGAFGYAYFLGKNAIGQVDWAGINQFSIAGVGNGPFNGAFESLSQVPEPQHYAIATGLALLGFAAWRRRSIVAKT